MKKRRALLTICKVLLCCLFVPALIATIFSISVCRMFDVNAVEKQLQKQGFYAIAPAKVEENISNLQGVIGIETKDILAVIPDEQVRILLKQYTTSVSETLLLGKEDTAEIHFTSDELYNLVCTVITAEQYKNDTVQMQEDRKAIYADLTAEVNNTLSFFPQTLYASVTEILENAGFDLNTVYAAVNTVRHLTLPLLLGTLVLLVGIFLCGWYNKPRALRTVAGCAFITTSVFFLLSIFVRSYPLLDRLSLSDGLLRRYVLAVFNNMGNSIFLSVTVAFVIATLLLIAAIAWEVIASKNNTCTQVETVIE